MHLLNNPVALKFILRRKIFYVKVKRKLKKFLVPEVCHFYASIRPYAFISRRLYSYLIRMFQAEKVEIHGK